MIWSFKFTEKTRFPKTKVKTQKACCTTNVNNFYRTKLGKETSEVDIYQQGLLEQTTPKVTPPTPANIKHRRNQVQQQKLKTLTTTKPKKKKKSKTEIPKMVNK